MFPDAACRHHDPNLWFSPAKKSPDNAVAAAICGGCPHQQECLEYSLEWASDGIWGGLTADQRAAVRRERGIVLRTAA